MYDMENSSDEMKSLMEPFGGHDKSVITRIFPECFLNAPIGDATKCLNGGFVYGPNFLPSLMSLDIT